MKIVKSSCSSKRKVRTCTFSPQVNIKNKRTAVQTEQDVNAAHSEAKLQDLINDIKSNIYTKVKAVATSPKFGFDENEVDDYFFVEVSATKIGEDHHEAIRVEVRGEVSYEGLEDLMEALNPIIESYDSYAYFEPVEPGIIEAYVSVNQIDMSIYGATASPDHMFYDYHGKRFSVHDNSSEIGEDNIDDVYFLWKGNISQEAGAYNDADEDYVYAFIRGRGVIEYYKKGKYVATDNYTLRDEDDFEYAWEYMEIILQHICDRLIAYNKDVPDHMVYNSTDIEDSSDDSIMFEGNNYEYVTNNDRYWIYRAVIDGKGVWRAMPQGSDESEFSRLSFPISYDQARGFESINEPSRITKLRKDLGKKLLPKSRESVEATEDLTDLPENFQHAYTLAKNDFMNDYSSSGVEVYVAPDDFNAEDGEICLIVKGINRVGRFTQGKVYVYLDEEDPDVIYTALEETANALSIEPGSSDIEMSTDMQDVSASNDEVYYPNGEVVPEDSVDMDNILDYQFGEDRDPDNSHYTTEEKQRAVDYYFRKEMKYAKANSDTDDKIFIEDIEDIIDGLEDNGYDLSRIRSIRQGLLELFGYKGKDADIIIHDLVAGKFIDPNDWVDKDYTPGIYSATDDGEGYWFFTTHGVQPGSVPRDVDILDIIDTPNGSFVKFDRFLSTKELNEYDMVEKAPKSVMSAEADELRSEDDHWVQEIEWAMSDLPSWFKVKGDNLHYKVTYNNQTVDVEFSVYDIAKYTYYINGDGPYTTNQAERIGEDIENYIDGTDVDDVFSETEYDDSDLPMVQQEYDSAATSINSNKLPAIYKMVNFNEGDVVVDFGGGKFDNAVEYIRDKGATLVVYDPYNRSAEHNREVLKILRENGGADAAVNSNVLNVIKEPEARKNVLENIARITKPGAPIYITVYEGKGNGQEGPTKSGYQLNRKTADYLEEIQEVFPDATRRGKLITAHNSGSIASSEDITAEYNIQFKRSVINELRPLLVEKLESKYGIEFFVTDMFIEGDSMHIQVYGDDKYHGDIDIPVDYSFDIWDLLEDAFNKFQELFDGKSSSPVKSYTDVEEDISRYDKDVDRYHMMVVKPVEDSDGFLTEYAMYEVRLSDGSIEYECYLGDRDLYGPWNGEGLDFESDRYDEAAEWWNDYNEFEVDDITSSTILDANPEFRNNFEEAIDFFYEDYPATVELTDEVDEDYDTLYKAYVKETGSLYQQTPGIVYIDINWDSGEILQALQETAEAIGIEQYPDNIESSESVEGDAFSQLEDAYLSSPEYDDPIEHEDSQELIEVELDQVITVDVDGDYEWDDDTYVWASPNGSNEEWRSEDGVYIDDKVGVVEHIDDLIIPNVPTRPGKYRVTGLAELIYDVSGIQEYRTKYGPDDYESDLDTNHAAVSFNFSKSSVENLKITPVRR